MGGENPVEPRTPSHVDTAVGLHDSEQVIRQICQLIEQGVGDEEIACRIETNATHCVAETIAYLRTRDDLRTALLSDGEN